MDTLRETWLVAGAESAGSWKLLAITAPVSDRATTAPIRDSSVIHDLWDGLAQDPGWRGGWKQLTRIDSHTTGQDRPIQSEPARGGPNGGLAPPSDDRCFRLILSDQRGADLGRHGEASGDQVVRPAGRRIIAVSRLEGAQTGALALAPPMVETLASQPGLPIFGLKRPLTGRYPAHIQQSLTATPPCAVDADLSPRAPPGVHIPTSQSGGYLFVGSVSSAGEYVV